MSYRLGPTSLALHSKRRALAGKSCLFSRSFAVARTGERPQLGNRTGVSDPHGLRFGFAALAESLDQKIEHGDEKQVQDRAHDHAAEDGRADGAPSMLACS